MINSEEYEAITNAVDASGLFDKPVVRHEEHSAHHRQRRVTPAKIAEVNLEQSYSK
jgi:hypothetical protein